MLMFESWASDLATGDLNRASDLFAFDIYASSTIPLLRAAIAPGTGPGHGVWITWPIIASKTYRVEFKQELGDATWQPCGGNVTIIGTQGYLYDLASGTGQRFYRVVGE
jgi:hypothetical protein